MADDARSIYGHAELDTARLWAIGGPQTHGEAGLALVTVYDADDVLAWHLGPDDSFTGTPAQLCAYLRQHGYTDLDTDSGALAYIWEGGQP